MLVHLKCMIMYEHLNLLVKVEHLRNYFIGQHLNSESFQRLDTIQLYPKLL
jgi:hypothetical protein